MVPHQCGRHRARRCCSRCWRSCNCRSRRCRTSRSRRGSYCRRRRCGQRRCRGEGRRGRRHCAQFVSCDDAGEVGSRCRGPGGALCAGRGGDEESAVGVIVRRVYQFGEAIGRPGTQQLGGEHTADREDEFNRLRSGRSCAGGNRGRIPGRAVRLIQGGDRGSFHDVHIRHAGPGAAGQIDRDSRRAAERVKAVAGGGVRIGAFGLGNIVRGASVMCACANGVRNRADGGGPAAPGADADEDRIAGGDGDCR